MFFNCKDYFFLLTDKKIIFINTPLQFINLIELEKSKNNLDNCDTKINKIFLCNAVKNEIIKVNFIKKKLNLSKYHIIDSSNKSQKIFIIILLNLRRFFFSKISLLIIGDYNNPFFLRFFKMSKKIIILDDGTSTLDFNKKFQKLKELNNNIFFFSFFEKKILRISNYVNNDLKFFKNKVKNKVKKNYVIILGMPAIERKFLTKDQYFFFLQKICQFYKNYKVYYFPHPKENVKNYNKLKFFKIIYNSLPIELYLMFSTTIPFAVAGSNSTAFVLIKRLYNSKIKISNFNLKIEKQYLTTHYLEHVQERVFKIIDYFYKYLKIKTIYIVYKKRD
jgi:hypothetical protein